MKDFLDKAIALLTVIQSAANALPSVLTFVGWLVPDALEAVLLKLPAMLGQVIDFLKQLRGNSALLAEMETRHGMTAPKL